MSAPPTEELTAWLIERAFAVGTEAQRCIGLLRTLPEQPTARDLFAVMEEWGGVLADAVSMQETLELDLGIPAPRPPSSPH